MTYKKAIETGTYKEAIETGYKIRRKNDDGYWIVRPFGGYMADYPIYYVWNGEKYYEARLTIEDIKAEDWEVAEC
jgi:hypothetical protein